MNNSQRSASEPVVSQETNKNGAARPWRILVVEDNAVTADNLQALLGRAGYEVRVANDGRTALRLAEAESPDAVLLDLGLPGMDGYAVAQKLRETELTPRPLLIAVTGHGDKEARLHSYKVGIDLHLTKPVTIEELQQFLERFRVTSVPPGVG